MDESDLQFTEVTPYDDGSFSTDVVDQSGSWVATVIRSADGTTQSQVSPGSPSSSSSVSSFINKVTSFLDSVAHAAQTTKNDVQRIQNAVRGATTGAQIGYNAPTTMTPYLIAGGAVLALLLLGGRRR